MKKTRLLIIGYGFFAALFLTLSLVVKVDGSTCYYTGLAAKLLEPYINGTLLLALCYLVCIVSSYYMGCTMFAILISRERFHDDVRKYGSKNAGMTNMIRVYGKKIGLETALGDSLKTACAILFGRFILGEAGAYLSALFCVLGHMAPYMYKFKGGKGVIASATAMLVLDPLYFLIVLIVFLIVFIPSHYVSMGSVAGAFVYPAIVYYGAKIRSAGEYLASPPALIFAFFVGVMVIFMHRANLKRVYYGEESKMYLFKKKKKTTPEEEPEETEE